MKVELELKNGNRRQFHPQVAKVLVERGLGKEVKGGSYQTRDMRAATEASSAELEALKAEADKLGIKYHHRAGIAKLRELLGL